MLRTLQYGNLLIRKDTTYMNTEVIDLIEDCEGNYYEVRVWQHGNLIARKI